MDAAEFGLVELDEARTSDDVPRKHHSNPVQASSLRFRTMRHALCERLRKASLENLLSSMAVIGACSYFPDIRQIDKKEIVHQFNGGPPSRMAAPEVESTMESKWVILISILVALGAAQIVWYVIYAEKRKNKDE